MQTVFSQRLLAELRTLHGEEKVRGDDTFQDPDDVIDPDDSGPRLSVTLKEPVAEIYALPAVPPCLALPPIPPAWSQLLCGRAHEAASAQYGRMALLAVGCRLGVTPSQSALEQVAGCRSVGAVRRLLILAYGSRVLSTAFELAGILQPPTSAQSLSYSKASQSVETAEQPVIRQGFTSQARVMRWFDRQEPVLPAWRSSPPPAGADDGSWVGC
jgi:hypothetical protein